MPDEGARAVVAALPGECLQSSSATACKCSPRRPSPQASAFKLFRDAATKQYGWLLGTAPSLVVDWERACGSIRLLLDGFSATDGTEERSACYCARVGTECERSGWNGPTSDDLLIAADGL